MKVSVKGLCRGNGKTFIKARVTGVNKGDILSVQSQRGADTKLPCNTYQLGQVGDTRELIIALPYLTVYQKLSIQLMSPGHKAAEVFSKRISPFITKWRSRLTYRINPRFAHEYKSADNDHLYNHLSLFFWACIGDTDSHIMRATVFMPLGSRLEDLSISCIDLSGNPVPITPVFLGVEKGRPLEFYSGQVQQAQVSLRLPQKVFSCCFILQDARKPKHNGFSVLHKSWYRRLLDEGIQARLHAFDEPGYDAWFVRQRIKPAYLKLQKKVEFAYKPLFSFVVPLYKTPLDVFCQMVDSVRAQSYGNWELILVQATPDNLAVVGQTEAYMAADSRIKQITLSENKGISHNTNVGLETAQGDYVCFFDHDDTIEPDLLFEYTTAINNNPAIDLLYCDEDKINAEGFHFAPNLKPDFNLDLLRNINYLCHLLTIKRSLLSEVGLLNPDCDGAQDHDLTLRVAERTRAIHHVSKVLYHWRVSETSVAGNVDNKSYATQAGIRAVQGHLDRLGIPATVEQSSRHFTYKTTYEVPPEQPLVTIVIPHTDSAGTLRQCIDSVLATSTYANYEVLVVANNNNSSSSSNNSSNSSNQGSQEALAYYQELEASPNIRVVTCTGPFNLASSLNLGVANSKAEYLILLNNNAQVITPSWIERMLGICARQDVGMVGAKLYYPDNTIQHAGIVMTPQGPVYTNRLLSKDNTGYYNFNDSEQNMSAVSAACAMTKRGLFDSLNGFNEQLTVAYSDVDYCLKLRWLNKLVVYTPEVELYCNKPFSPDHELSPKSRALHHQDAAYMRNTWSKYYEIGDPYCNKNFNLATDPFYYKLNMTP